MKFKKSAIVLCSGGLDSFVTAYYVKKKLGYDKITILFFNYGQKSLLLERKCAKKCAFQLKADFQEINLSILKELSTSLINIPGKVSRLKRKALYDTKKETKKWYVPGRNTLFLSYALSLADSLYISQNKRCDIFVGFKCEGKESYPDTTQEYISNLNKIAGKAFSSSFQIKAPLIKKDKEDIISLGKRLGVNYEDTFSCYIGIKKHCGYCLACKLRQEGFYWANTKDPTEYFDKN